MAKVPLEVTAQRTTNGAGQDVVDISLHNPTKQIAFFERAEVTPSRDGEEILPIEYSDNYVTVFPGETTVVRAVVPSPWKTARVGAGDRVQHRGDGGPGLVGEDVREKRQEMSMTATDMRSELAQLTEAAGWQRREVDRVDVYLRGAARVRVIWAGNDVISGGSRFHDDTLEAYSRDVDTVKAWLNR